MFILYMHVGILYCFPLIHFFAVETVAKVVDEYLPTIKGVSDGVKVNRLVCGECSLPLIPIP